jgi:hypothetical protein
MSRIACAFVWLGTCLLAACQSAAPVKTASEVALKTQTIYRVSYAGQQIYAGHWFNLRPDCSLNNVPTGTILTPPAHGTAEFKTIEDYTFYPTTSTRFACNKQKSKMLVLVYTPAKDYTGDDSVLVNVVSPPDMFGRWSYQIKVEPPR